ncbi:ABC transporter permease [Spongiivirga citrea]|uniref:FtsX-like permease family protein n=1 Tax=Spongiivirga citrea TaxID=1481457 RepID=A0A6M0CHB9_9FLAO|nr:ABC transporter permease [Spongiivirga citrea]NER17336.1 FtsX-like permease family protein [Spongiivirga citrea]
MFKNYIKIAWRNLVKSKSFSILNVLGLSTGMACSILILLWVQNEVSYDQFHIDSERTYRFIVNSGDFKTAVSSAGMGPDLRDELSEIESIVRITKFQDVLFNVDDTVYEEKNFMYVDNNFLSFFDFPLVRGAKSTALKDPNTIVLTESMAKKYFGEEDALGQTIKFNDSKNWKVTGVLKDLPPNSHFKFDFIAPTATIAKENKNFVNKTWGNFDYYSYFKLNKNVALSDTGVSDLEAKINAIADERLDNDIFNFRLQPLADIHLYSDLQLDVAGHGNIQYVNIFFIVALFILVVACINFMNLSTARSAKRAKEVGMRKAIGAHRGQLILQFLSESMLLSCISLLIAVGLVLLALPFFNEISGKVLSIDITDGYLWLGLLVIVLVTGFFAGSYPALYLSGFNPIKVLQGNLKKTGGNLFFRNGLVTMQFVISTVLIVGTAVVYNQLNFIKDKNLGFDKSNMIIIPFRGEMREKQDALKATLQQNPLLKNYSVFSNMPTDLDTGTTDISWEGKDENDGLVVPDLRMDDRFIDLFGIELLAGRGFNDQFNINGKNLVINETLMKLMGKNLDNIIGEKFAFNDIDAQVIGVVKDFHFKPLQYDIEPLVLTQRNNDARFLAIRTTINQTQASIEALENIYTELNPAFPFTYSFLDTDLENMYNGEQKMGMIFNMLAILAIFISCLGIYGLSAFMAEQRIKEIGIRKVLGATTISLVNLLSKDFFKLVLLALVIAIPLSWYYLNEWLQVFAYHINISWWMFAIAAITVFLITLTTVSYQSITTALSNPIKNLRTE